MLCDRGYSPQVQGVFMVPPQTAQEKKPSRLGVQPATDFSCAPGVDHEGENSVAAGRRPSGVYRSMASGRFRESLDRSSSRERPVCSDNVANTLEGMAFSS